MRTLLRKQNPYNNTKRKISSEFLKEEWTLISFQLFLEDTKAGLQNVGNCFHVEVRFYPNVA